MPKIYYCEKCLEEVKIELRAVPGKGMILNIIKGHECSELDEEVLKEKLATLTANAPGVPTPNPPKKRSKLDEAFDAFNVPGMDKRDKKFLREETTIAPPGILNQIKSAGD